MSNWRPLPDAGGSDPRPLQDSLDVFAARVGVPRSVLRTVFGRWEDVVGAELAAHTRPVRLADDVLVVAVDDPAWAAQVRWLGDDLLARLAEAVGEPVAQRLEVRVARR